MNEVLESIRTDLESGLSQKDIKYYYVGRPAELNGEVLTKGVVTVTPISTDVDAVTTGITDQDTYAIEIVVSKLLRGVPNNAQKETGAQFLMRVIESKHNGTLNTDTVRYILRNNLRAYGLLSKNLKIEYRTNEVDNNGAVSGRLTITVIDHTNQPIQ